MKPPSSFHFSKARLRAIKRRGPLQCRNKESIHTREETHAWSKLVVNSIHWDCGASCTPSSVPRSRPFLLLVLRGLLLLVDVVQRRSSLGDRGCCPYLGPFLHDTLFVWVSLAPDCASKTHSMAPSTQSSKRQRHNEKSFLAAGAHLTHPASTGNS